MATADKNCKEPDGYDHVVTFQESAVETSTIWPTKLKRGKVKAENLDKPKRCKGKSRGKASGLVEGEQSNTDSSKVEGVNNGLAEPLEAHRTKRKKLGFVHDRQLHSRKVEKRKSTKLKRNFKEKKKVLKQRKQQKAKASVTETDTKKKKEWKVTNGPQSPRSSDDENQNTNTKRDNGLWETVNMASSTGLAHRSDHSYDERDDLFFDSDDEREADIMENSDEDTEDASETDMATLEEEFTEMKEQMYQEKIRDLKQQLEQLKQGMHPEYLKKLKELEQQKEDWILMADAFREYELQEIEKEYDREERQAREEYEMKKVDLKESLIMELTDKKKSIESERMTLELTGDILEVKPVSTRKLRRRPNDPPPAPESKKRKTNSKAQLSLLLPEECILMDLKKLNKMTKSQLSPAEPKSPIAQPKSDSDQEIDHGPPFEAKIEDGKLFYEKKWYHKGQAIYLETKDSLKIVSQIHSIGTNEIWIKKIQENTRLKLYLSHLHKGKYIIRKRSPSQNGKDS